jgi:peroxiredoxin
MRFAPVALLALAMWLLPFRPALAGPDDPLLAVGKKAPSFELAGTDGKKHTLAEFLAKSKATAVVFTCNTCPYAQAYEPVLIEMAKQYAGKPLSFVLLNSNSPDVVPQDSYEHMVERAKEKSYPFPYLQDATQQVASAYGAQRTPTVFLLDAEGICRYSGRIDDNAKREQVKEHDLANAIEALLAGTEVPVATTKAFGCGIKWKKAS